MDEKVIGILVAAAGVTATEAAELLTTDEGIAELQSKVTAKLAEIKDNADKRATKKTREAVEAALKAKGIEKPSFASLSDHLDELESKTVASASAGSLTDDQVLKHPAVVRYKNQLTLEADQKVQAAKQEAAEALKKDREAFTQQQTDAKVRAFAEQQVDALKPVFSSNPAIAANQRKDLVEKLVKAAKWQAEGNELRLLDEDDELLKDAAQNVVKPEAKAREIITSYYELPVSQPRESAGVSQEQVGRSTATTYAGPKNQEEYDAQLLLTAPGADRQKFIADYKAYQETQTKTAV
ncbi:hypothetical protein F0P96_10545 [Hymenobacter busanensis]|uniref:Uncharacterized protein n=1 Tax=Hymenobacter busanensis TaxID=2607656 RepID=A0A7L4ZXC8_9BACT|nr:hypothetical protein [Hymenobacter busanensis]KAA9333399.1 hypothetical protein F0P96_10545 [Hymenobacter busanensis]QHJ07921.1 hypothetical protein GUY19_11760 [Hymenobacter busanensis]